MSSECQSDISLSALGDGWQLSLEDTGAYSELRDVHRSTDFALPPGEITESSGEIGVANSFLEGSNSTNSEPSNFLPSHIPEGIEIISLEDEESGDKSLSSQFENLRSLKTERADEDDTATYIKKEEDPDDCIIVNTWSKDEAIDLDAEVTNVGEDDVGDQTASCSIKEEDHGNYVIGNIWSITEAIDLDAEVAAEPSHKDVAFELENEKEVEDLEHDRLHQNHQAERIALARQRLQVRSFVNSPAVRNPQYGTNDNSFVVQADEISQKGLERSDDLFCSDYDEETKASLKRKREKNTNAVPSPKDTRSEGATSSSLETKRRKKVRTMKITNQERKESMRPGLESALGKPQKSAVSKKKKPAADTRKGVDKGKKISTRSRRSNKHKPPSNITLRNLLQSDVVSEARLNASKPAIPGFSVKNKKKALEELVGGCRSGESQEVKADKARIKNATEKFGRLLAADGKGGWKLKGMKTSLFHHQILGLEFMWKHDRENSKVPPFGGFLCDEMGFGKTIQALANLIVGAPDEDDAGKTTLIVVPRHLVSHWARQINTHCEGDALGSILRYHAGSRIETDNPIRDLGHYEVIITTYEEVRRSYPFSCPPSSLRNEEELRTFWERDFGNNLGALHSLRFRRIILDEAHMIKNPDSNTSIAVRGLTATYRWAMSGTIIQNGADEFLPFFDFLKIPEKGIHGYGHLVRSNQKGKTICPERVSPFVEPLMLRRTHISTLFGFPIVKLPDIEERRIIVDFNKTERFVQRLIGKNFVALINSFDDPGDVDLQYRCILTTYLRLRMLTSHFLLVQGQLKELLTATTMKELRDSIEGEENPQCTDQKMVHTLERLMASSVTSNSSSRQAPKRANQKPKRKPTLRDEFREFVKSLKASSNTIEIIRRCVCPVCEGPPIEAHITECMHLFCEGCLPIFEDNSIGCTECEIRVEKTEYCNSVNALELEDLFNTPSNPSTSSSKRGRPKASGSGNEKSEGPDWITLASHDLHGAKLDATRDCIREWFSQCSSTKVLVFTQFLDMGRILAFMCETENWGFAGLNGKMSIRAREEAIKDFRENDNTRIMICSLRAGGIGLDLTMANKCVLLDLWWNKAVEQQAFCRAFRIGQEKNVEIVKVVANGTTDNLLTDLQNRKAEDIDKAMGEDSLPKESIIEEIAKPFGNVTTENGLFRITSHDDGEAKESAS